MVKYLAVVLAVAVSCGPGTDSDVGEVRTRTVVVGQNEIDAWVPAYSPNGERIAWYGYDSTFRPRVGLVDGTNLVPVTGQDLHVLDFAWMPDSERLLVAHRGRSGMRLAIVDLTGNVLREIELNQRLFSVASGMAVIHEGAAVMSAMRTRSQSPSDLYRVDLRTGRVTNLTKTKGLSETWPVPIDSSRLLMTAGFISQDEKGPSGWAAIFDAKSGKSQRLTGPEHFVDRATSALGSSTAVFDTSFQGDTGLWMLDIDGGEPRQLLEQQETRWPAMSPDGKRLLVKVVGTVGESGPFIEVLMPPE